MVDKTRQKSRELGSDSGTTPDHCHTVVLGTTSRLVGARCPGMQQNFG